MTQCLAAGGDTPTVASTDYIRAFAEQIRAFVPGRYKVLGTDGFGRSDYRRKLRSFFEVDRHFVAVTALKALAELQLLPSKKVAEAIELYHLDPEKPDPTKIPIRAVHSLSASQFRTFGRSISRLACHVCH